MSKKQKRVAARLPRGFEDRNAADLAAMAAMTARIREVFERYGFDPLETPLFEYTEALGKFLPDTDRPNAGVFSLQDDDEQWLSLRYDLTAPLARHFAEHYQELPKPYRTYREGYVFRNEKPGPGRFRQFMQFDADTVGAGGPEADAEMCMMMADTMDALGLEGQYVVKVNNRKVLDGVMEAIGVADEGQKLRVLRAIDKLDRLGVKGVRNLLGEGRKDESGDFTDGAGLSGEQVETIVRIFVIAPTGLKNISVSEALDLPVEEVRGYDTDDDDDQPWLLTRDNDETIRSIRANMEGTNALIDESLSELQQIADLTRAAGYPTHRVRIDPSVVRGLEYYTGPVFEIELTFPVTNERGETVVFGSVGGGGRYDGLVSRFRPEPTPATGFSIGVSRLLHALKLTGNLAAEPPTGPVVVLVMEREHVADCQRMVAELRNAGIRAELYLGATKNFGKQLAYADKRRAPAVVIEGADERARGVVQIKDLRAGAEAARDIADRETWTGERPGQWEARREDLVRELAKVPAVKRWLDQRARSAPSPLRGEGRGEG